MIKDKFDLARFGKISHKIRSVELRKKRAPRFVSASLDISKSNFSDFFLSKLFSRDFSHFHKFDDVFDQLYSSYSISFDK